MEGIILHVDCKGEALRLTTDKLNAKNFYAFNPGFDTKPCSKVDTMK